jgi:hypothetical protein
MIIPQTKRMNMGVKMNWDKLKRVKLQERNDRESLEKLMIKKQKQLEGKLKEQKKNNEYLLQVLVQLSQKNTNFPCNEFIEQFVHSNRTMTLKQEKYLLGKLEECNIMFDLSKLKIKTKPSKPSNKHENVRDEQKYVYELLVQLEKKNPNFPAKDFIKQFIFLGREMSMKQVVYFLDSLRKSKIEFDKNKINMKVKMVDAT